MEIKHCKKNKLYNFINHRGKIPILVLLAFIVLNSINFNSNRFSALVNSPFFGIFIILIATINFILMIFVYYHIYKTNNAFTKAIKNSKVWKVINIDFSVIAFMCFIFAFLPTSGFLTVLFKVFLTTKFCINIFELCQIIYYSIKSI